MVPFLCTAAWQKIRGYMATASKRRAKPREQRRRQHVSKGRFGQAVSSRGVFLVPSTSALLRCLRLRSATYMYTALCVMDTLA